jgi:hypothetical protein
MRERSDLRVASDDRLLRGLFEILKQTRHDEADLIAHIAEVDARRLYAREAAPSMFSYCTEVLHLSEPEAALRIRVARASRKHPVVFTMLRDGRIHLSGIALLAPLLTRANRDSLLRRATHKSKRQIEEMVAELVPRPDVPAAMRRIPVRRHEAARPAVTSPGAGAAGSPGWEGTREARTDVAAEQRPDAVPSVTHSHPEPSRHEQSPDAVAGAIAGLGPQALLDPSPGPRPARAATVEPLAPGRYSVRFTASAELRDKLERLQALMRHSVPDADLATIIDVAVTREVERLEAKRFAKTKAPRKDLTQTDTDAEEFVARVLVQIPDPRRHLVRYYG